MNILIKIIKNRNLKIVLFGLLSAYVIWLLYIYLITTSFPKAFSNTDITTSGFANSVSSLSALFAAFAIAGVLITLYIQVTDSNEAANALAETARESKEKAILDLYQTFSCEYFQEVKTSSHNVLIAAVKNKDYADFMISRFFVIGQEVDKNKKYENIRYSKKSRCTPKGIKFYFDESEQKDRFKLDELINFFTLLSNKESSKDIIKSCDFFYDWWRPLFWFIAIEQLNYYNNILLKKHEKINLYCKKPNFIKIVEKLDEIYEYDKFSEKNDYIDFWKYFVKHPKIISYEFDERYLKNAQ